MWLIIKLIIACVAGLIRLFAKQFKSFETRTPDYIDEGTPVYITTSKNKGNIVSTTFSTPLKTRALFRLTKESEWDRLFKGLGISKEFQSGDKNFDDQVYVACDHPILADEIQQDEESRRLILSLLNAGAANITYKGEYLQVTFPGDYSSKFDQAHTLSQLKKTIDTMDMHRPTLWSDPYARRVLATEVIIWTFAGYAFSGFLELILAREDYHLYPRPLYIQGLLLGLVLAAILVSAIVPLFRGSSRGHRIIIEAFFVLGLALPMGGICLISDLNRELDKSEPVWAEATVSNLEEKVRRSRRGGKRYDYYMYLYQDSKSASELELPVLIQIDRETFLSAKIDDIARIQVGRGWLKHPWYRAIHFRRRI